MTTPAQHFILLPDGPAHCRRNDSETLDLHERRLISRAVHRVRCGVPSTSRSARSAQGHSPPALDALKARLNRKGSLPGTAVITGSTRQDALPATAQTLTGRLHALTIWPLFQGEIAGVREDLLGALRADPEGTVNQISTSAASRMDYVDRVCAGGLPAGYVGS